MAKYRLCKFCLSRFRSPAIIVAQTASDAECFICNGAAANLGSLVQSALQQSAAFEWKTFAVSSSFPREVLVREEEVADNFAPGDFSSMKNAINAEAIRQISSSAGKRSTPRFPDAIFSLGFKSNSASAKPTPIYIAGHYLKLSRKHCQSRWHCSECGGKGCESSGRTPTAFATPTRAEGSSGPLVVARQAGPAGVCKSCGGSGQNYPSVEEEIGSVLQPLFGASSATLHACGREDVDVRMLGNGRPFVMELKNPKKRSASMPEAEKKSAQNDAVHAIGLRIVPQSFMDAVCNSHFDKEYSALVSADRPLTAADAKKIESMTGAMIFQQTPQRVLARRSDMERKRKVLRISASAAEGGKLALHILAEAGTYIKELINGDDGRTKPNISSLLLCRAACDELDVAGIRDYFLQTIPTDRMID